MNTTYDAEMVIWITDLKGVRLPFRAAALVYKFMVRVICETNLQWTLVCPSSYEGSSMKISSDKKVATTKLDDCYVTWVVSGPLNDTLPSYFQIKIHQIGLSNAYCSLGVVSNKIMANPPLGGSWTMGYSGSKKPDLCSQRRVRLGNEMYKQVMFGLEVNTRKCTQT